VRKFLMILACLLVPALAGGVFFLRQQDSQNAVEVQENIESFTRATEIAREIAAAQAADRLSWEENLSSLGKIEEMVRKLETRQKPHFPELRKITLKGLKAAQEAIRIRQGSLQLQLDIERGALSADSAATRIRRTRLIESAKTQDTELQLVGWELCAYLNRPEKSLPGSWPGLKTFHRGCGR
jgi:hypothetical protein